MLRSKRFAIEVAFPSDRLSVRNVRVLKDCSLSNFRPLTVSDVVTAVRALPDKQSTSDPLPAYPSVEG